MTVIFFFFKYNLYNKKVTKIYIRKKNPWQIDSKLKVPKIYSIYKTKKKNFWTFDFVFNQNKIVLTRNWNVLILGWSLTSYNIKLLIYIILKKKNIYIYIYRCGF